MVRSKKRSAFSFQGGRYVVIQAEVCEMGANAEWFGFRVVSTQIKVELYREENGLEEFLGYCGKGASQRVACETLEAMALGMLALGA